MASHKLSPQQEPTSRLRRFRRWFHEGFKPGDLVTAVSVLVALGGVWLAFRQFKDVVAQEARASQVAQSQTKQAVQQSENNAPFLIPATPPAQRGTVKRADLNFGSVTKRADRLYVAPPQPRAGIKKARLVIPLQNGGSGIALVYGKPVFISDCNRTRHLSKRLVVGSPGTYVVRSGQADQFGFFQPSTDHRPIKGGGWYSFDYNRWGRSKVTRHKRRTTYTPFGYERNVNVVIWYSDGARSTLRWMCAQYLFAGVGRGGLQYAVTGQTFGEAGTPPAG